MFKLLKKIFLEYDFTINEELLGSDNIQLALSSNGLSNYIVIKVETFKNLNNDFYENIYKVVFKSGCWKSEEFKNSVLIILHLEDEEEYNAMELSKHHQILEEDKFLFKKHALTYTKTEIDDLRRIYKEKFSKSIRSFFDEYVFDEAEFKDFKKNKKYLSGYGLLLKIFIKLPFIKLHSREFNFYSVSEEVSKEIKKEKLYQFEHFSLALDSDVSLDMFVKLIDKLDFT